MADRLNITDLAEKYDLARDKAKRILDQAGVHRHPGRLFDEAEAATAFAAVKDAARSLGNHLAGRGVGPVISQMDDFASAKAEAERARARKLTLDVETKEKTLVSRAVVTEAAIDFATTIRNAFLGVAPRIGPRLAGLTADEITIELDAEVRAVLTGLANIDHFILGTAP